MNKYLKRSTRARVVKYRLCCLMMMMMGVFRNVSTGTVLFLEDPVPCLPRQDDGVHPQGEHQHHDHHLLGRDVAQHGGIRHNGPVHADSLERHVVSAAGVARSVGGVEAVDVDVVITSAGHGNGTKGT